MREAEFVSPDVLRLHYTRIVEGYESGLRAAQRTGDVDPLLDPATTAWALMGMGELIGMRFLLWERDADGSPPAQLDPVVFDAMTRFIDNALAPRAAQEGDRHEHGPSCTASARSSPAARAASASPARTSSRGAARTSSSPI